MITLIERLCADYSETVVTDNRDNATKIIDEYIKKLEEKRDETILQNNKV